jgi:2'-5' RNA ligase
MPYAITLKLDAEAAAFVVAMWERLASRGVSDEAVRLGYPPHLTLGLFSDAADLERLVPIVRDGASRWRNLPISLASLGWFPGAPGVLFLAPVVTPALLALHRELLTSLPSEHIDPLYQPDHWVPHVTLAAGLSDPIAAVSALELPRLPIAAVLDTIDVVRFPPVEVLARHLFTGGSGGPAEPMAASARS